jgi:hypothetical protein
MRVCKNKRINGGLLFRGGGHANCVCVCACTRVCVWGGGACVRACVTTSHQINVISPVGNTNQGIMLTHTPGSTKVPVESGDCDREVNIPSPAVKPSLSSISKSATQNNPKSRSMC